MAVLTATAESIVTALSYMRHPFEYRVLLQTHCISVYTPMMQREVWFAFGILDDVQHKCDEWRWTWWVLAPVGGCLRR